MNKESITFGKIEIEEREYFKYSILIDEIDIVSTLSVTKMKKKLSDRV